MIQYDPQTATTKERGARALQVERCTECGASPLRRDQKRAEVVCTNCGFVVHTTVADRGPEWRAFTLEQYKARTRVGAPSTFAIHDKGLSTQIAKSDIRSVHPEKRAQLYRMRKWQRRSRVTRAELPLTTALSEIHRVADALSLPKNVVETAARISRKAIYNKLCRGRALREMATAAIYLACRRCGVTRTVGELAQISFMSRKTLGRYYRYLVKELDYSVPYVTAEVYVTRLCNELSLNGKVEEVTFKILKVARKLRITSGRMSKGLAAAAGYIASKVVGEFRTQRELAAAVDITEVTIRNRYKEILNKTLIVVSI